MGQLRALKVDLLQKIYTLDQENKKLSAALALKENNDKSQPPMNVGDARAVQAKQHEQETSVSRHNFNDGSQASFLPQFHSSTVSLASSYGPTPFVDTEDTFSRDMDSRLSTGSLASNGSMNSRSKVVPNGSGTVFACEDEDPMFSNKHLSSLLSGRQAELPGDRISEIQRRNTLQLPHMRSVYPAEYQFINPVNNDINEDSIRVS